MTAGARLPWRAGLRTPWVVTRSWFPFGGVTDRIAGDDGLVGGGDPGRVFVAVDLAAAAGGGGSGSSAGLEEGSSSGSSCSSCMNGSPSSGSTSVAPRIETSASSSEGSADISRVGSSLGRFGRVRGSPRPGIVGSRSPGPSFPNSISISSSSLPGARGTGGGVSVRGITGWSRGCCGLISGIVPRTFAFATPSSVLDAACPAGTGGVSPLAIPFGTGIGGGGRPVIVVIGFGISGTVEAGPISGDGPGTCTSGRTNSLVDTSRFGFESRPSDAISCAGSRRIGPVPTLSATIPDISPL